MMRHFLYVFSDEERDALLSLNYKLLKSDAGNHVYVFENEDVVKFDQHSVKAVQSDVLTF